GGRPILPESRATAFSSALPHAERMLPPRVYERFPSVPADPKYRDERCSEVYEIQVQGLATRLRATGIERVVLGISGGLDSTQALLVCAEAMDRLGLSRKNIIASRLPGFVTDDGVL